MICVITAHAEIELAHIGIAGQLLAGVVEQLDVLGGPRDADPCDGVRRQARDVAVFEAHTAATERIDAADRLNTLVLPAPFGPMIENTSPRATVNEIPSTARMPPKPPITAAGKALSPM